MIDLLIFLLSIGLIVFSYIGMFVSGFFIIKLVLNKKYILKDKIIRIGILLTIIMALLWFVQIFAFKDIKPWNSSSNNMTKYMEKKYNDSFTITEVTGGGIGITHHIAYATSKKYPDHKFKIYYEEKDDSYKDDYIQYKYEENTKEYIKSMLENIFNVDVIINYNINETNNKFNDYTTFDEFINSSDNGILFEALVSDEYNINDIDILSKEIKDQLEKNHISIEYCTIYFANNKDTFYPIRELRKNGELEKLQKINLNKNEQGNLEVDNTPYN